MTTRPRLFDNEVDPRVRPDEQKMNNKVLDTQSDTKDTVREHIEETRRIVLQCRRCQAGRQEPNGACAAYVESPA